MFNETSYSRCSTKEEMPDNNDGGNKRIKLEPTVAPPFYFNLHKHHPKVPHQKSIMKVVSEL